MIPWILKKENPNLISLNKILDYFPRPDRSGVLSIVICLAVVLAMLEPHGSVDGKPSLVCTLIPWLCPDQPDRQAEQAYTPGRWVTFYPGGHGKSVCTCHIDFRWND